MGGDVDLSIEGLSDYRLIGSGGFAMVYSAFEHGLNRQVAVKVLAAVDESGRRRFDRERMSMGRTADHPNIVTPLRSGYINLPDARPFLVMEYLSGGSLQDRLNGTGPMPWAEAIETLVPIADALAYSHDMGVIHKDIKPGNILLSRTGTAKLTDFGIASVMGATATTQVAFSLAYAAPETFGYDPAPLPGQSPDRRDNRSDIYSLIATLYALGTGAPPYQSESWGGLMSQIVAAPVPQVGIEPLDRLFARAMAKEPADRHQTAHELLEHLRVVLARLKPGPLPSPGPSEAPTERAVDLRRDGEGVHPPPGSTMATEAPAVLPVISRPPLLPPDPLVVSQPVSQPVLQPQPQPPPAMLDAVVAAESDLRRRGGNRRWQPIDHDSGDGPDRAVPGAGTGRGAIGPAQAEPATAPRPDLRLALLAIAVLVAVVALVAAIRLLAG